MILRVATGHFCPCWPLGTAMAHEGLAWKTPIRASAGLCSLLIRPSQRSKDSRHEGLPSRDLVDWQVHWAHAQALHTLLRHCFCSPCYLWLRNKMKKHFQQLAWAVFCPAASWGFAAHYEQPHWHVRVHDCVHGCDLLACAIPHVFKIIVPVSCWNNFYIERLLLQQEEHGRHDLLLFMVPGSCLCTMG